MVFPVVLVLAGIRDIRFLVLSRQKIWRRDCESQLSARGRLYALSNGLWDERSASRHCPIIFQLRHWIPINPMATDRIHKLDAVPSDKSRTVRCGFRFENRHLRCPIRSWKMLRENVIGLVYSILYQLQI